LNQQNTVPKRKTNKRRTRRQQPEKEKEKTKKPIYVDNHLIKYKER
jgi:hypothetical protein